MRQALASRTIIDGPAPSSPPPSPEEIADKFPQFEILECLGRGGMGVVYKARQKSLNRVVAIKILAPEREREARFAERFAREAELLAKLNHPHIVTIHDFGETGGLFYLVMEFVDGVNLRDLLRDGKLEPKQALAIVPPICEALQYAHEQGIVHRDIKPENLLLDRAGRLKIADFGIASLAGASDEMAGTPVYMAPEQSGGSREVDSRADIYALGVVLYEMLTGERPAKDIVPPSRKVQIDVRLDEMVLRALEKSPELRYQTAGEFRTVVETIAASPPSTQPAPPIATGQPLPGTAVFTAIAVVLLLVLTAFGDAMAMMIGSAVVLAIGLFWFAKGNVRLALLVAMASLGVAGSAVLLMNRKHAEALADPAKSAPPPPGYERGETPPRPPGYEENRNAASSSSAVSEGESAASGYIDLAIAVIDAMVAGKDETHPEMIAAKSALIEFTKTHPTIPDAVLRRVGEDRLARMKKELDRLKEGELGNAEALAMQDRCDALAELVSEPDKIWRLVDKPRKSETTDAGSAEERARQLIEAEKAIYDAHQYLDLELAVIDAKAGGIGDKHPTMIAAASALARFKETHPAMPDSIWRRLAEQRLAQMQEKLAGWSDSGLGKAHPTFRIQQIRIRALAELLGKPVVAEADGNPEARLTINIGADGRILLEGVVCEMDDLKTKIAEHSKGRSLSIEIKAEQTTPYDKVVKVLEACKEAGIDKITFSAGQAEAGPDPAKPVPDKEQIAVEDLALRMMVAIREKDDATLKSLATDRIKGWPDALPQFAVELREHFRQFTGSESFDMRAGESLVDGDLAAVRCTGPAALQGKCLVLFFVKTGDGWRNHSLRNSTVETSLATLLADLKKRLENK
jgi:tRNA A-37 threonylcarbamoyl transferase component Bud32